MNGFPVAHTCFFTIDIPDYDSLELMTERFKFAIEMCGEIDADEGPEYIADDASGSGDEDREEAEDEDDGEEEESEIE